MTVSQEAVDELRREGQALNLDDTDFTLKTLGEIIGFMVVEARALGMSETEMLDAIEIVVRAAQADRQELRTARTTLKALHYSPALVKLLTMLARKAAPPPVPWTPRGRPANTEPVAAEPSSPQPSEATLALRLLRPKRRGQR